MILDSLDALPGCLPGLYRGVSIHVLDAASEHGRRVLEYLFPGVDAAAYDDFGVLPSIVSIEALILADDYKAQARRLQRVFETPGPGLLVHPWMGPMAVIMEEPARISFSARELRVVRISARFKRMSAATGLSMLGGSGLVSAISAVIAAASAISASVSTVMVSASGSAAVRRSRRIIRTASQTAQAPTGAGSALAGLRETLAASTPDAAADLDLWVRQASLVLQTISDIPAVASASASASTTVQAAPSPQSLMTIGLDLAAILAVEARRAPSSADTVLLLAAAVQFLSSAAYQVSYADYASSQEAVAYRTRFATAIASLIEALEVFGADQYQSEASALIRAGLALSAAIVTDLNEVIGRLPAVLSFANSAALDAWQLAVHVAGDQPSRIEEVYADIVARNDPRLASAMEARAIEVRELT